MVKKRIKNHQVLTIIIKTNNARVKDIFFNNFMHNFVLANQCILPKSK